MGKKLTIKINKNSIFYFIAIIPFIQINYLSDQISIWSEICFYARIIIIIFLLFKLIMIRRRLTVTLGLAILFFGGAFFSTFLAGISYSSLLQASTYLFGFTLLLDDGVYCDINALISGWLLCFEILIYLNLIFYIIMPNGYKLNYYLFGNYNTTMRKVLPGIILGAIHAFNLKGRINLRFCCMYVALLFFLIRVGSMTSIFGMVIFIVAILYYMLRKKSGVFKLEFFLLISLIITFAFAIFGRFNLFERFITIILGKDMTLTHRTAIWARTLQLIREKPIWGYGQLSSSGTSNLLSAVDPHNMFLGTLFYFGIVGMVIVAFILWVVLRKVREGRKKCPEIAMIFDAGFCAIFVMWNFEPFSDMGEFYKIFVIFAMACYCMNFAYGIKKGNST